jgi:hypothetical protein
MKHQSVYDENHKREFLRNVLGLEMIQSAKNTKPYLSGNNVNPESDMAFIESVKEREGRKPSVISSYAAREMYESLGITEITNKIGHYNDLKGSGEFETDRLGIVIGCPQPSDNHIELWGALAGHSIRRKEYENGQKTKGVDLDFGEYGNKILLDSRENEVLQAAMRFGREESNGEKGARVYIHTAAIPNWIQPELLVPKIHSWDSDSGVTSVIQAIKSFDDWEKREWKTSDISNIVKGIENRQVLNILKDPLAVGGYVNYRRAGRGNGYVWSDDSLDEVGSFGFVDW